MCIRDRPHSETVQYYCAKVPPEHRDSLIDYLASKNIHTSVHFKPLHKYNVVKGMNQREYPVADVEWKKLISLPCHPAMTEEDITYVISSSLIAGWHGKLISFFHSTSAAGYSR